MSQEAFHFEWERCKDRILVLFENHRDKGNKDEKMPFKIR